MRDYNVNFSFVWSYLYKNKSCSYTYLISIIYSKRRRSQNQIYPVPVLVVKLVSSSVSHSLVSLSIYKFVIMYGFSNKVKFLKSCVLFWFPSKFLLNKVKSYLLLLTQKDLTSPNLLE